MAAAATDKFTLVGNPGSATTLAAPGHTIAGTTFNVTSTSNWPTTTGVVFAVDNYTLQTVNGVPNTAVRTPGTYTEWEGVVASGTQITGAVLRYGTDQNYAAGSLTRVYIPVAAQWVSQLVGGILVEHDQDGTHGNITGGTAVFSGAVTASSFTQSGGAADNGWTVGLPAQSGTIVANGNRSYDVPFASTVAAILSPSMRLRTTRTVAAPTQCTSLNGTSQYYSKTSPAGMTFTVTCSTIGWRKLNAYSAQWFGGRTTGTNGFRYGINASGQLIFEVQPGNATTKTVTSYQSVPLTKGFRFAFQIDLAGTCAIMLDGADIPSTTAGAATSLTQAGDWQLGAANATGFTNGKMAQDAIFSAKISSATVRSYEGQSYLGTETSLVSAYSFNNSINDLNTTNANNLTANGSAVATNADSPFGGQADGTISSTLDYAIITKVATTTVTVQVPEGNTIPTSGGVSAVSYSTQASPYGFPAIDKFKLSAFDTGGTLTNPQIALMVQYVTNNPIDNLLTTHTGTWGGTMSFSVNGTVRSIALLTSVLTSNATYTVIIGGNLFSTLRSAVATTANMTVTASQYAVINALALTISATAISASGTSALSFYIVGT